MSETKICGQTCGCTSADQCQFTKWIYQPKADPNEQFAILITNRFTNEKYLYPKIYNQEEAEKALKSIPQSQGGNNILEIIKLTLPK